MTADGAAAGDAPATDGLVLSDVARVYGAVTPVLALDGVSVAIAQGEFVAIEGESGGGKSTLLNVLGLLDTPTRGEYRIDGHSVGDVPSAELPLIRSDHFAYVFQAFHILERRPVVDSVELPMVYRGIPPAARRERALAALGSVGISGLAHSPGRNLSGGQRQRVAIARALAAHAPVLLADEPTGNLDSVNTQSVMESIERVHRTGVSVILVTHSEALAERADRRIRISDGVIRSDSGASGRRAPAPPRPEGTAGRVRAADALRDAWANVVSRAGRTAGLVAAISASIALAVVTSGLAFSAQAQVSDAFNAAESTDVAVEWNELGEDTGDADDVLRRLGALNGVVAVGVAAHHDMQEVRVSSVRAALIAPTFSFHGDLASARFSVEWAAAPSDSLREGEALIGRTLATQLELAPLRASPVVEIDGESFAIVGIVDASPRNAEWLGSVVTGPAENGYAERTVVVTALVTTDIGAARQVSGEAPRAIDPYDPDRLVVHPPADPNSLRATIESSVQSSLLVLTVVAMLGSVVTVILATLAAVAERRGEIGLRRALGAQRKHIWSMLMLESAAVGLSGGVIGLALGLAAILAVTIARQWTPIFDGRIAVTAIAAGVIIGGIGAVSGALRAQRITPSEALRPGP